MEHRELEPLTSTLIRFYFEYYHNNLLKNKKSTGTVSDENNKKSAIWNTLWLI
jgi:hypothetical protein